MIVRRRREPAVNGPPKGATQRRRYLTAYQDRITGNDLLGHCAPPQAIR